MAIIIFNPTDEILEGLYVGERVVVEPGAKLRVDDARGRHLLNSLGRRGLMTLEYGDEGEGEEKKIEEGRRRNLQFKRDHVIKFNEINEQRFQQRMGYNKPDSITEEYAKETGIGLREPYRVEDVANEEIAELRNQVKAKTREVSAKDQDIEDLKGQVGEMKDLMERMLKQMGNAPEEAKVETLSGVEDHTPTKVDEALAKFQNVNGKYLPGWMVKNWTEIKGYPEEAILALNEKCQKLIGTAMPASLDEAKALQAATSE